MNLSTALVTINDLPVTTTLSLEGISNLTAASTASLKLSLSQSLGTRLANIVFGAFQYVGRRLLDVSVPVTISGLGNDTAAASSLVGALASLPSSVAAAINATGVVASTAVVTASLGVQVTADSFASANSVGASLNNATMLQSMLSGSGMTMTSVTITSPPTTTGGLPSSSSAAALRTLAAAAAAVAAAAFCV